MTPSFILESTRRDTTEQDVEGLSSRVFYYAGYTRASVSLSRPILARSSPLLAFSSSVFLFRLRRQSLVSRAILPFQSRTGFRSERFVFTFCMCICVSARGVLRRSSSKLMLIVAEETTTMVRHVDICGSSCDSGAIAEGVWEYVNNLVKTYHYQNDFGQYQVYRTGSTTDSIIHPMAYYWQI